MWNIGHLFIWITLCCLYALWVLCVCFIFLNFGSFKCFGVKCGIYFAEQIYMGGLALFSTHELPLCCDHDYYCFRPSHSKFPVGCGFHMLKASWRHLNVLYFNSYSLLYLLINLINWHNSVLHVNYIFLLDRIRARYGVYIGIWLFVLYRKQKYLLFIKVPHYNNQNF